MNAREMYDAIQSGSRENQQQVLFELLGLTQTISTAVLELAGTEKLRTGKDPLGYKSRLILSEFLGLETERGITQGRES